MRICICEDDLEQIDLLKEMLLKNGNHKITVYQSSEELLFMHNQNLPFDCLFLDISMLKINGLECARIIREFDNKIAIVFITSSKEFVFEGYEVSAVRYLLKPINYEKIAEVIKLIENKIMAVKEYIYVNNTRVNIEDILYIESIGHYCQIITNSQCLETKINLKDLKSELKNHLIQIHRSYLVNLKYVSTIKRGECILENKSIIPISRAYFKTVNQSFIEYIKGGLGL